MNRARQSGGALKNNVKNARTPNLGSKCSGNHAKPIDNAVAARPKSQGYAPIDNAVSGKKKF